MKVAFETLGCKLNQYETDSIATTLKQRGWRPVSFHEEPLADAYVINTCTVTNKADRKSRNILYRVLRQAPPGAPVILTGCFVESSPDFSPESDRVYLVDNSRKSTIPHLLEAHLSGEMVDPRKLAGDIFGFTTPEQLFHTRTSIKIQDGCDNFCSFCIIPFVRGAATSRPAEAVLNEARQALEGGSRELVLTGINMSRYRSPREGTGFPALVREVLELPGSFRLRISSLEPDQLTPEFLELFSHPRMTPHLHLCLQSGSDRILKAMNRTYTSESYRRTLEALRRENPLFNVTTDIIVGFPGESESDLEESLRAIRDMRFGHVHTFPFSVRKGTGAARLAGSISTAEKRRRSEAVLAEATRAKRSYRSELRGVGEVVLIEGVAEQPGSTTGVVLAEGLGAHYVPIRFSGESSAAGPVPNRFYRVVPEALEAEGDDPFLLTTQLEEFSP
ncbi:tRNA (N(6)-L-threonylcarbamoyladenosine(37)-C(2))-methylthiotransferase MtaB [Alkalispirochaeta alkalica]|uniref:tRNA (N(6)-L-threonylcarbamoyladenosine(37)-C(2))- methylthiotransferase MtaB n=1 Tax=Alkalispirochaeta alkalica TaxID=46356 RepID=UPI00036B1C90|nr:tRNA (N(6)-L-threonylcarbamoyladenosine(37)-C(2))-methylthiotransferase MtaB [Alkalispirochaeta alkalica]